MCGRFSLRMTLAEVSRSFEASADAIEEWSPRFNIAPSQDVVAARLTGAGRELVLLQWGLVPSWYDDPATGGRFINARAESAHIKPTFRDAFWNRRCLVGADGFYEWRSVDGAKQPYYIRRIDGRPFGFAGLWERWKRGPRDAIESCTILTTRPNEVVEPLHDRMPVIVSPEDYDRWLNPRSADLEELEAILQPCPADEITAYPVSRLVNDPANDSPACIDPDEYEPPPPPIELDLFS